MLNILDVPKGSSGSGNRSSTLDKRSSTSRQAMEIPTGRGLSPSRIIHPKPSKPYESRRVREADYSMSPGVDDLTDKLEQASLYKLRNVSPSSSVGSSLSSRSTDRSSPSSLSSLSSSSSGCRCNRYGVTRRGDRIKLDCGGSRCGSSDDSSSGCSSIDSESEDERPRYQEIKPRTREIRPRQSVATGRSGGGRRR